MFAQGDFATQFHKTYFLSLVQEIFAVMTGRPQSLAASRAASRAHAARCPLSPPTDKLCLCILDVHACWHPAMQAPTPAHSSEACWCADTMHKPGFKLHARILHHLFGVAASGVIKEPLWDVASTPVRSHHCAQRQIVTWQARWSAHGVPLHACQVRLAVVGRTAAQQSCLL